MSRTRKMVLKKIVCIILVSFLIFPQNTANINAATHEIGGIPIVDGFTPPKNTTIIHYLNTGENPYTKIANAVSELWVGDHHRFTVVANKRENIKIRWYSSNPEIASIKKTTGELTALSVGETTVTMWDSTNKKKHKITLTVKPVPVLPEIPREWYTVAEKPNWSWISEDGVQLILKSKYRDLYEQCSMIQFPEYVDGEKVVAISVDDIPGSVSFRMCGFTQLKMLQCPPSLVSFIVGDVDEVIFSESSQWIDYGYGLRFKRIHVPESTELFVNNGLTHKELGEVRIPASVKFFCDNLYDGYYQGVPREENVRFVVDGNNTNYYSISDVLFAYPYHDADTSKSGITIWGDGYVYGMHVGKYVLLSYPPKKAGEIYYVPDGIERIEDGAFSDAQYLKKIILPDSVTEIGEMAFYNIRNKVEITIPASVTKFEDDIHGGPFCVFKPDDEWADNFTIITPKGSAAEAYAIEKGIAYRNE